MEATMSLLMQGLMAELKHEAAGTRKTLERVPVTALDYKPHDKSMALGPLANHIADMMNWIGIIIHEDQLDFGNMSYKPKKATNAKELVEIFDENYARAVKDLEGATEEQLMEQWTLRHGDHVIFTMPKGAVLRNMVFNHVVHHRAQLGVYLRLNGIAVPGLYGPSADEQ